MATMTTADTTRLAVETKLATLLAIALGIPVSGVQVGYFAAAGRAIITIPVATCSEVGAVSSKASQALIDAGSGIHFFDNGDQGPALGRTDYRARIVLNVR
ncbi:hypothetical protein Q8791_23675 [Nocardiopsis sp. CT-R113]|uniref:Uncharacterized protein n=1 Tax=Nocardiopsis codii TaxID=3065942 RepID=A0ABU7KDB2_9ACTN|nr:hypothetical protein [Nocardiopsis sp. CT-R113]MEE2040220.1 hypothetical protein [Nocardiopsis sp. CT-R113]